MKMRPALLSVPFLAFLAVVLQSSCNPPAAGTDRNEVLASLASQVIVPSYEDLVVRADGLVSALETLCSGPSEGRLEAARIAWKDAQVQLKRAEVFAFGPYKDGGFDSRMDFWPVREDNVEEAIAGHETFGQAVIDDLGVAAKGLPAIEYLLFGGDPSAEAKRCAYTAALGRDFAANARALRDAWAPSGTDFSLSLSEAGRGSELYPSLQTAMSVLVNQMGFLVELVKDTKIGKPLGKRTGGDPQPDLVESPYSDVSLQSMAADLQGLKDLYLGSYGERRGLGVYHIVRDQDAFLADLFVAYIDESIAAVEAIPEPFESAITDHPDAVEAAFQVLARLKANVQGPISGLLGVTPFFNDNDGD